MEASMTRAEMRAQQTNERRERVFKDLFQSAGWYQALRAGTSFSFRGRSPPLLTDTWLTTFTRQMELTGRDALEDAQKKHLQNPDSDFGPYQEGEGCDPAREEMTRDVIKLTIEACCTKRDLKDGVTYDMLEKELRPIWYEIKEDLKEEVLGEGFPGAGGSKEVRGSFSDDQRSLAQPDPLFEQSQKAHESVSLRGSPLEVIRQLAAGGAEARPKSSQKAPGSDARLSPHPEPVAGHAAAGEPDTMPDQPQGEDESSNGRDSPHPIVQALEASQPDVRTLRTLHGSQESLRAQEMSNNDLQSTTHKSQSQSDQMIEGTQDTSGNDGQLTTQDPQLQTRPQSHLTLATPTTAPQTEQNPGRKRKRTIPEVQQSFKDIFENDGYYSASRARNWGRFRGHSKPSEQDAWYTTLKRELKHNSEDVLRKAERKYRQNPIDNYGPYENHVGCKAHNQRLADKAIDRTLADCNAEEDLKDREGGLESLQSELMNMYTQFKATYKKMSASEGLTKRVKRVREDDSDDRRRRHREPNQTSRRTEGTRDKQASVNMPGNGIDIRSPYESAQFNYPVMGHSTQNPFTAGVGAPYPPIPTPQWPQLRNVYIYLYAWSAMASEGKGGAVSAGAPFLLNENASLADLWLTSRILEGQTSSEAFSFQGPRRIPMPRFPDLTDVRKMKVLCLEVNQDRSTCLILASENLFRQCLDRARQPALAYGNGIGSMSLLLFDESSLQGVCAHFGL